jgi:hypothetical protein
VVSSITWARLLAGRWRDPVVGRDLLVTLACVALNYAVQRVVQFVAVSNGAAPHNVKPEGFGIVLDNLASARVMAANLVTPFFYGLVVAGVLTLALWFSSNGGQTVTWMNALQWGLEGGFLLFLTLRFGVFASVLFSCLSMLIDWSLFTSDFGAWYGRTSLVATMILGVMTLFAFRISIGKRPVLGTLMVS